MTISQLVRDRFSFVVVAVLTAITILPVFLVAIPAMEDFLNHLSRMYILVTDGTASANPYYQVHWALYPNLAMDILIPPMAHLIGVQAAAKVFLVTSQLLVISGAMAIEFAVKRKLEIGAFAALLVIYSTPFAWGLLNFEFGMGVALWGIASWIAFENYWWFLRVIVHSIFAACLLLSHFFAFGVYCATIGLLELPRFFHLATDFKMSTRLLAIFVGPIIILLTVMSLTKGMVGGGTTEWKLGSKLLLMFFFFNPSNYVLSTVIMALFIALLYFLFRERYFVIGSQGKWIVGGFFLLFIFLPFRIFGVAFADIRIINSIILVLPAFTELRSFGQIPRYFVASTAALMIIVNASYTAFIWRSYQDDYADIITSFSLIKPNSAVLVGRTSNAEDPIDHAPTLAVYYAKAFVPSLYALPGMQPVEVRPQYSDLRSPDPRHYGPIPISVLKAAADKSWQLDTPSFVIHWTRKFDYLYLVGSHLPNPIPTVLSEISTGRRYTLYRINK